MVSHISGLKTGLFIKTPDYKTVLYPHIPRVFHILGDIIFQLPGLLSSRVISKKSKTLWCGQGESNSQLVLGKDALYHLTMPAFENRVIIQQKQGRAISSPIPTRVLPLGFEPRIAVPKTAVISVSPREQYGASYPEYALRC